MSKKIIFSSIILCLMVGVYFLNLNEQKNYKSSSSKLLNIEKNSIKKILIQSNQDAIELMKQDTTWTMTGIDTLVVKQNLISNLLDNIISLETQMLMTQKEEKWSTYNVDDTTGTHLALVDLDDNTIGYYVFGNSSSDYSRCYVRSNEIPNVYLTNNNIMYHLQTMPEFWGEKPKEIIPQQEF